MDKRRRVIRASEIGQYAYCARAWWLSNVKGVPSSSTVELAHGEVVHQQHGRMVWAAGATRTLALVLAVVAVILLLAAVFILK